MEQRFAKETRGKALLKVQAVELVAPLAEQHGISTKEHSPTVRAVLTDNGRKSCSTNNHPHALYLALNDIKHRRANARSPKTSGFVERL